ncbi:MAG: hypothetical protein NC548_40470 [Lachnospiraceae bacterium]|nr:hypothetical protein [Lachnospiraceae bacterium]
MRYIFYRHDDGWLILRYSDDNGKRFSMRYLGYTLSEAISKFRRENHLRRKHIKLKKL